MIKRGERGFTLIELLIVVAILGVLAAVVIPNVGRFFGRGEEEARRAEKHNVESAIVALMTENGLSDIPNAKDYTGGVAVQTMTTFPDSTSDDTGGDKLRDPSGELYDYVDATSPDSVGYLLYGHDIDASDGAEVDDGTRVNYVTMTKTKYYYTCESDGTIRQWDGPDPATATEYTD
ncbi:type II secretion system protein [Chloroflexota bacterium]